MNKIKQHVLSKFLIKNWGYKINKKVKYKFFNIKTNEIKEVFAGSNQDIFLHPNFYEQKGFKNNEIENKLKNIEDSFKKLIDKIFKNIDYDLVKLSSFEMILIFCWYHVQNIRTKNWRDKKIDLWNKNFKKINIEIDLNEKFRDDKNKEINDVYEKIFSVSRNPNNIKKIFNIQHFNEWTINYGLSMLKKRAEVEQYLDDFDKFKTKWMEYENLKFSMHNDYLTNFYWFYWFFKPIILKTNKTNPFILVDEIFEDTLLNYSFHVHSIPISPELCLAFVSKDMDYNFSTIWPIEFNKHKDYFKIEYVIEQINNIFKNKESKIPIINLNNNQLKLINSTLLNKSNTNQFIIPWNFEKNKINKIVEFNCFNEYEIMPDINVDFKDHFFLSQKNRILSNEEVNHFMWKNKNGWYQRIATNPKSNSKNILLKRFKLIIDRSSSPNIYFGKYEDKWFFSYEKSEFKEFTIDWEGALWKNDIKCILESLIYNIKLINLNKVKELCVMDILFPNENRNHLYFSWDLNDGQYALWEMDIKTHNWIKNYSDDYLKKYCSNF